MDLPDFLRCDEYGQILLTGHRIGLAHVLRAYQRGDGAEMIALRFPTLALAHIHRVLAFYLENTEWVDKYLEEAESRQEELRRLSPGPSVAELRARLAARQHPEPIRRGA